jgi:hypothetical protein
MYPSLMMSFQNANVPFLPAIPAGKVIKKRIRLRSRTVKNDKPINMYRESESGDHRLWYQTEVRRP